jgi:hypothetical protein
MEIYRQELNVTMKSRYDYHYRMKCADRGSCCEHPGWRTLSIKVSVESADSVYHVGRTNGVARSRTSLVVLGRFFLGVIVMVVARSLTVPDCLVSLHRQAAQISHPSYSFSLA